MPKIGKPRPQPHANADRMARDVQGCWQSSMSAAKACRAVGCPRCRAAKGWPCFSVNGIDTPTPHAARWEAYREFLDRTAE